MFQKNVGTVDKVLRLTLSAALTVLLLTSAPVFGSAIVTGIVGVFALINAVTGLLSVCIVYSLFDLSTSRQEK